MIIIMLGAPGAGKGTIGKKLSQELDIIHLSSGDIFRTLIKENTDISKRIEECINAGKLIPDDLAMKLFEGKLIEYDLEKGIILDGYPRTEKQAEHLDKLLKKIDKRVTAAVNIDISEQLIIDRIVNRRICSNCGEIYNLKYGKKPQQDGICDKCGHDLIRRADDNEKTVKDRLKTYNETTKNLLAYYEKKGLLFDLHSDENTTVDKIVANALLYIEDM